MDHSQSNDWDIRHGASTIENNDDGKKSATLINTVLIPCVNNVNCLLRYSIRHQADHNAKYSHPCRFSELCLKKEPHYTHEPHRVLLCRYDQKCNKLDDPFHRAAYRHTDLSDFLVPCRNQAACHDKSIKHRMKYSHGENVYPMTGSGKKENQGSSSMRTESTTNLLNLYSNWHANKGNGHNVVLIMTGALNPIHRGHMSIMIKTKEHLERVYNFNVIGGYISPTHDDYVRGKLKEELIHGQHRIEMCRRAIEEAGQQYWLNVDEAECMAPQFISLVKVTMNLQEFLNDNLHVRPYARVIFVAGLDLFNRCRGMRSLRAPNMGGVAVVHRAGEDNSLVISEAMQNNSNIYHVPLSKDGIETSTVDPADISSTEIRKKLKDNKPCEHLTYMSVLDYLKMI